MNPTSDQLFFTMQSIGVKIMRMRGSLRVTEKAGFRDIVTDADHYSEQKLREYVQAYYPGDGFNGEEGARGNSSSGYVWYFDPIDGTTNFACGPDFFAISARRAASDPAAESSGEFGGVYFPVLGDYFFAKHGKGAMYRSQNLHLPTKEFSKVVRSGTLRESVMLLGLTDGHEALFGAFRGKCRNVLMLGSCVYEAMCVVNSKAGAYLHTGATPYDIAAVELIAREAGCVVGRPDGKPINLNDPKTPIVFAANQGIFDEVRTLYIECTAG
jgi:myo-inositol-1(or 4)-monophosphatase